MSDGAEEELFKRFLSFLGAAAENCVSMGVCSRLSKLLAQAKRTLEAGVFGLTGTSRC